MTAASAAGLNTCLPPDARRYFEAIAHTEAKTSTAIPCKSVAPTGSRISARIRAVI